MIVAWYGVNFVLGAGLHSYGFGGGGKCSWARSIGVQALYVGIALWRLAQSAMSSSPRLRIAPASELERGEFEPTRCAGAPASG